MMNKDFEGTRADAKEGTPVILCIGIGDGGEHAISYMHEKEVKHVTLTLANSDQNALQASSVTNKLQLGPSTTSGLGAGANLKVGTSAALESKEEIDRMLSKDFKMVFLIAGMGGGTGTGAAPIIANMAKEKGMLVVGLVTMPFRFEGAQRKLTAEEGLCNLEQCCDALIIVENEGLMHTEGMKNLALKAAFRVIDQILCETVISITAPISEPGVINIDFQDMCAFLRHIGQAFIGTGIAAGEDRGIKAMSQAIEAFLLQGRNIKNAKKLFLSMASSMEGELTLQEISQITLYIREALEDEDTTVIWGHAYEKGLEQKVRISIMAAGFPEVETSAVDKRLGFQSLRNQHAGQQKKSDSTRSLLYGKKILESIKKGLEKDRMLLKTKNGASGKKTEKKLEQKIVAWRKQTKTFKQSVMVGEHDQLTDSEVQELLTVPTYKRKNISLSYVVNPETPLIRHQLQYNVKEEK